MLDAINYHQMPFTICGDIPPLRPTYRVKFNAPELAECQATTHSVPPPAGPIFGRNPIWEVHIKNDKDFTFREIFENWAADTWSAAETHYETATVRLNDGTEILTPPLAAWQVSGYMCWCTENDECEDFDVTFIVTTQ